VCFFVTKEYRRRGVAKRLLKAAVEYVREQGGSILEGYAVEPKAGKMPDLFAYMALLLSTAVWGSRRLRAVLRRGRLCDF